MPEVKSHEPGSFCWFDLATTDPVAAKRFYSELLGWSYDEMPMPEGEGTYSMAKLGGKNAAAMSQMRPEQRQQGIPPYWNLYVAVKSADETTGKATSLGAKVLMAPFDIPQAGRMAVLQDPSGAAFSIWQPGQHPGADVVQEKGAFCWAELGTRDVPACRAFYGKLFGWETREMTPGGMPYWIFSASGKDRGGMMTLGAEIPPQVPAYWGLYFAVADCDGSLKRTEAMGGKAIVPAMDLPGTGRFAILSDPQGATFGILQPAPR